MPMILLRMRPQGMSIGFRTDALGIVVPVAQGEPAPGVIPVVIGSNIMTPAGMIGVYQTPAEIVKMANMAEAPPVLVAGELVDS